MARSRDTKTWKPLSALELKYRKIRENLARNLAVGSRERERERERGKRARAESSRKEMVNARDDTNG